MAESILYDVAGRIISNVAKTLASPVLKEIGLLWGLNDELAKLNTSVSIIQAVLLDAEDKSMEEPVKIWLEMLSEAMYDVDDLLDEFSTEALRQQVMSGSKTAKKVRLFFSSSNQFAFGLKMAHKVKALRKRLDEIANTRKFHLAERYVVERVSSVANGRDQTHSFPQVVVGRDADKEKILKHLLSSDYPENVSVVPIVGIGGLGKTTLAQMVCNDDDVKNHFELKMWVCVSDDFDVKLLVKKVIESATGQLPQNIGMDPLRNILHEKINGRKYLLVLDDVWNQDLRKWFSLTDLLVGGARGSKIVLTTRLPEVAKMSRPIYVHELSGLSNDESWSLFKKMAFKQGQVLSQSHEAIGRAIVAKCGGVPLAIRAIGGMMYSKDSESEWLLLKNEELSKIHIYTEDILPILKLSYNHLPLHYKHCFAYCSLYPKDCKIGVEELIYFWKAQGYLKSTNSNECLQDVGFRCFMDLLRLSFFQDAETDDFGNITECKMHDLMHDLAVSVAGDNFSTSRPKITNVTEKTRHISFHAKVHDFSLLLKAKKIRTLRSAAISTYIEMKREELDAMFCNLRCLRVLSLFFYNFDKLPSSIDKLKHLRHLDFSGNHAIKKLPDSIINLQNLQVLKLSGCRGLRQLPDNITKLVNLSDLDNDYCDGLTHMPRGIGKMTHLEKLSLFVIAKDNSIFCKRSSGLDELHALNNLRGSLEITNLKYMKNAAFECKEANLNEKEKLQRLTLCWKYDCSASDVGNDEMVLEALQPHQNLKGLSINSYGGVRSPSWLPSLTNLVFLKFSGCISIQRLPPFDQLPFLRKLFVVSLTNLEQVDVAVVYENRASSSFFPSLFHLILKDCPNLKGFVRCKTDDIGLKPSASISMEELPCFPSLSILKFKRCPNLTCMPFFPELETLQLRNTEIKALKEVLKRATTSASESISSPAFSTLSQLVDLTIWDMEDCAVDELLQYLPSLQSLSFRKCPCKILSSDEKDDGMQWQSLKVLRSVEFGFMQNLVSMPKGLQYVTTLQRLDIDECASLASIPEWMGRLIELQDLRIYDCPKLSERCKNNTAEDWHKISHIPNISIDYQSIQRNGCYLL